MSEITESILEEAALSWFSELSYAVQHGPALAPGEAAAEGESFGDVVLIQRRRDAIDRLNPKIPHEARDEALRKVVRPDSPSLVGNNRKFQAMLRDAVEVEYRRRDGTLVTLRDALLPKLLSGEIRVPESQQMVGRCV
ncbi:MAG: hypothetical protein NTY19_42630 [Planctomycetota bacterium]|nr:hypothetical protein [Planctomycetota bacterium]